MKARQGNFIYIALFIHKADSMCTIMMTRMKRERVSCLNNIITYAFPNGITPQVSYQHIPYLGNFPK